MTYTTGNIANIAETYHQLCNQYEKLQKSKKPIKGNRKLENLVIKFISLTSENLRNSPSFKQNVDNIYSELFR